MRLHLSQANKDADDHLDVAPEAAAAPGKRPLTSGLASSRQPIQRLADADADATAATDNAEAQGADAITVDDVRFEIIAHNMGYQDTLAGVRGELLQSWGYQPEWASKINDAQTGLFVGLLMPDDQHPDLLPILVFRGTEGVSDLGDLASDVNLVAVGHNQFEPNRNIINQMIAEAGGRVNVTGHSLGGALAQHCAAAFTGAVEQVYTYQSPAIEASQAQQVANSDQPPEVRHHLAKNDLVDNAGDAHLGGEFFRHDVGGGPASHVRYLLMSVPDFAAQREELGLTDEVLDQLGVESQPSKGPIEHTQEYPDETLGTVSEAVRRVAGLALYPILSGLDTLMSGDDIELGQRIDSMSDDELAGHPVSERAYMVDRMCRGVTVDRDEKVILRVLRASGSDMSAVVDVVGAHVIAQNMHGKQFDELMELYRSHYFPRASQDSLLELIKNCIEGRTSGWEQEIIADILVTRSDGRALITRIGADYAGGGFAEGLKEVQWQLGGAHQRRVDAVFAG